jgi:outer membrane protein assembly factor BamB
MLTTYGFGQLANSPWPKFHGNALNDGQGIGSGATSVKKWGIHLNGAVRSSPALGLNGTVVFGSDDFNVYSVDSASGAINWKFATGDFVRSSPAVGKDGTVYVASENQNVYALKGTTGVALWARPTLGQVDSSPAIGPDGTVYVGCSDGNVLGINGATGALKWSFLTGGPVTSSPAVDAGGTVYVGSADGNVYAFDGSSGVVKWHFTTGGPVLSSPALDANAIVYVGSDDGIVRAFYGATGAVKWTSMKTNGPIRDCPAIGYDGTVYVGTMANLIYSLNGETGAINWTFKAGAPIESSVAIASDGSLYFGSLDKTIYCINGATGSLNWSYIAGNQVESSPAVDADGSVYIGADDNFLYAFQSNGVAQVSSVSLSPATVNAGSNSTGIVTISNPAPTGGAVLCLSTDSAYTSIPPSVTIGGGATSTSFTVSTSVVPQQTVAHITAAYNRTSVTSSLTINPGSLVSLYLTPPNVVGGNNSIGTVTVNGLAPPGGLVVGLSSSNAIATVPSMVTVPAGQASTNFTITTTPPSSQAIVTIGASLNGTSETSTLTVIAPGVASVTLNPATTAGGASSVATITLNGAAPSGGALISVTSSNVIATVPSAITIPAGQTTGTLSISTKYVTKPMSVTITATLGFSSIEATLTLNPLGVATVTLNPTATAGGNSVSGTVTLNGPAPKAGTTVSLSSSIHAATVPSTVKIPSGQLSASFTVKTSAVGSQSSAVIGAKVGNTSDSATLTILPPALSGIALSPASVYGGATSTATISLTGSAPTGGLKIALASNQACAVVPSTVTIPPGKASVTFSIKAIAVSVQTVAAIGASLNGVTATASLTVNPPILVSLTLTPASVPGGKSSTGTVKISGPAPAGGLSISLSSSDGAAQPGGSVIIPAGKTSANFTIKTTKVSSKATAKISGTVGGASQSATLTIT